MPDSIERFFQGYVDAFNRSLGETVDVEGIRAHFSQCFVAAGPQGVTCGQNDESFTEALQQGYAFYTSIGTKAMAVRGVTTTPIDESHQMAKVDYRATYEKPDGERVEIDFAVIYLLAARATRMRSSPSWLATRWRSIENMGWSPRRFHGVWPRGTTPRPFIAREPTR